MIRRILYGMILPILAMTTVGQAPLPVVDNSGPPAPASTPLVAFRTRLTIGDADRNWTYIHRRDGSLASTWKVNGQAYTPWTLPAVALYYDSSYHGGFSLPSTVTTPGTYAIDCGRGVELTVAAVAAPSRKAITIPYGASAPAVNAAITGGYLDITLAPGEHVWDRHVALPDNAIVRGYGAKIRRTPIQNYGGNWPCFYIYGQDVSIYGCEFFYNDTMPNGCVLFSNPTQTGLVFVHNILHNCNMGFYFNQDLVRDNKFEGAGAGPAAAGMWLRNIFSGPSAHGDPWQYWAGLGYGSTVQMIDNVFRGTQRGPVFNAQGQSISDVLFCGVECHDITRGNNGNECWLCEGGPLNNFMALHCRVRGCESSVFQFDGGATNGLIRDFTMDGGLGIIWLPQAGASITNMMLQDFQLMRCAGFYAGPGTTKTILQDGLVIAFTPTRGNQTFSNGSPLGYSRKTAIWAEGPGAATNTAIRVPVVGLTAGMAASVGFTLEN